MMTLSSTNDNYIELKRLLMSWNVLELFQHFCDEGINIDELQMMKHHHIELLLCNFKLGLRIRFEHHFENWRQQLDKPLMSTTARCCNCWSFLRQRRSLPESPTSQRFLFDQQQQHHHQQQQHPQPLNSSSHSPSLQLPLLQRRPTTPLLNQLDFNPEILMDTTTTTTITTNNITSTADITIENEMKPTILEMTEALKTVEEISPNLSNGTVSMILQMHGQRLLDYYGENNKLLPEHRVQLIDLIVRYYRTNQMHMSLNMSYRLEEEILEIFPNEKLNSYRTNKRGKLYIKYSNSKRSRNYLCFQVEKNRVRSLRTRQDVHNGNVFVELPMDVELKTEKPECNK